MTTKCSKVDKELIIKCVEENTRIDARRFNDYGVVLGSDSQRGLEITFNDKFGSCNVRMGPTYVLAEVSAEIGTPKSANEGNLLINLHATSMSEESICLYQMLLERCFRECVDMESLCLVPGSKVWTITVDIHILNDKGNSIECASVAAMSGLDHFQLPNVTVVGTDVTIHSLDDREPIQLKMRHYKILLNVALFNQGKHILLDPCDIEEKSADGCYVMCIDTNSYKVSFSHMIGDLTLSPETIHECEKTTYARVLFILNENIVEVSRDLVLKKYNRFVPYEDDLI